MILNINDFKSRIKAGKPEGWYILTGEEDYLKSHYRRELLSLVLRDGALDAFNHAEWNGLEFDFGAIAEALVSPPMMQEYKLVEWRFANLGALSEKELKILTEELFPLKEECPFSVFLISTTDTGLDLGTPKKPSKLSRLLSDKFDILSFPKSTDNQLLSWLKKHFDAEGIEVSLDSLNTMLGRVGHSMEVLHSEVEKLSAYLHQNGLTRLNAETVEAVCPSNIETESFALQNSIFEGNIKKALCVLADMKAKRTDPQIIMGSLASAYSKLSAVAMLAEEGERPDEIGRLLGLQSYPLQLNLKAARKLGSKRINSALKSLLEADASSKFGGITGYQAIEIFITQNI